MHRTVCTEVDELASYANDRSLCIDATAHYDVVEHVHDVGRHLQMVKFLSNSRFRPKHVSGANAKNPLYVRSVKKQADRACKNRDRDLGTQDREPSRAYLDLRRGMVTSCAPGLSRGQVESLARSTRGLVQRDIDTCVVGLRRDGSTAHQIDHFTDTRDPTCGHSYEHFSELQCLEGIPGHECLSVGIATGRHNACGSLPRRVGKLHPNARCRPFSGRGMFVSQYYVVFAEFAARYLQWGLQVHSGLAGGFPTGSSRGARKVPLLQRPHGFASAVGLTRA